MVNQGKKANFLTLTAPLVKHFRLYVALVFSLITAASRSGALFADSQIKVADHGPTMPIFEPVKKIEPLKPIEAKEMTDLQPIVAPPAPAPVPDTAPASQTASGTVANCGDNESAHYIYMHESGCRLDAMNAGGCLGIGQACPGSKLRNACPDLSYACQNAFFTDYANRTYGGWGGAYNAWVSKHWW